MYVYVYLYILQAAIISICRLICLYISIHRLMSMCTYISISIYMLYMWCVLMDSNLYRYGIYTYTYVSVPSSMYNIYICIHVLMYDNICSH